MDKAIIFFRSHSLIALNPAITIVRQAIIRRAGLNHGTGSRYEKNRIRRKTPAVTSVDECTRAETGVGAAIAAGSQLEKGICALLVMAAPMMHPVIKDENGVLCIAVMAQWPWLSVHPILKRRRASPIRLVRAVIIPAPRDLGFW